MSLQESAIIVVVVGYNFSFLFSKINLKRRHSDDSCSDLLL